MIRMSAMALSVFGMVTCVGLAQASSQFPFVEEATPLFGTVCNDAAGTWLAEEVFMDKSSETAIEIQKDGKGQYVLVTKNHKGILIPSLSSDFLAKAKQGKIWMVIALYDDPVHGANSKTGDYQIQVFAESKRNMNECLTLFSDTRNNPVVVGRSALEDLVKDDLSP